MERKESVTDREFPSCIPTPLLKTKPPFLGVTRQFIVINHEITDFFSQGKNYRMVNLPMTAARISALLTPSNKGSFILIFINASLSN